jgi:hypothetical protein
MAELVIPFTGCRQPSDGSFQNQCRIRCLLGKLLDVNLQQGWHSAYRPCPRWDQQLPLQVFLANRRPEEVVTTGCWDCLV